ncbi:MAG: metallophosphoesterase, partial [bacterium]|nr:metallophosphoesterase [bacterium]
MDNVPAGKSGFPARRLRRPNRVRSPSWQRQATLPAVIFILAGALLEGGCGGIPGVSLPNESTEAVDESRFTLLARFVHLSDAQIIDEESPARLTVARELSSTAWRPHEAYSTQLLDGMIRTVNKMHVARETFYFLVHTGDAADNAQRNELDWFMTVIDGGQIDPRSAIDDRQPSQKPDPLLDPHAPFESQGLYRSGVHGDSPTIPWYALVGNHDHFAVGVFPIVTDLSGNRISPLMWENRIGLFLPVSLNPIGVLAYAPVTPANPAPPVGLNLPTVVPANPDRAY